jgi:hypothetical protein
MTKKFEELKDFSDPVKVYNNAKIIYGDDIDFDVSNRKDKKYRILNPQNNKWVHFGQMNYEDFTKHKDIKRMENFKRRNHKWANADMYSPAYLSYHLLW